MLWKSAALGFSSSDSLDVGGEGRSLPRDGPRRPAASPAPGRSCWVPGGGPAPGRAACPAGGRPVSLAREARGRGRRRGWPSGRCCSRAWTKPRRWTAGGRGVPRVRMRVGGGRAGGMRLRDGLCRDRGAEAAGRQVSPDAAPRQGGDGGGVPGARPAARAGRRRQDPDRRVGLPPDGLEARGVGHGHGDAPGGGADPRHRVVAGPPVSRRQAPVARHPRRPAPPGPVPAPRALDIVALLADALAAVYETGYLRTATSSRATWGSRRTARRSSWTSAWPARRTTPPAGASPLLSPSTSWANSIRAPPRGPRSTAVAAGRPARPVTSSAPGMNERVRPIPNPPQSPAPERADP